ncbi:MAG: NAD(P)H-hydrate dehydratase, partial [Lachnospiraceae bacterium]|nr:NAD(P)H-hydrate dehydratase [Lachnospiraceae bacterium]
YGIGCSRPVNEKAAAAIDCINASRASVLSVDMPGGICADTGRVMGTAFRADVTVTFSFYKLGQMLFPGREYCGKILLKNAGIVLPAGSPGTERKDTPTDTDASQNAEGVYVLEDSDMPGMLPKRNTRSHKGTYGRALLFAGSVSMPGAMALAAQGAYRTGCGLTEVCSTSANLPVMAGHLPEAVFTAEEAVLADSGLLSDALARAGAVLIGPGWGRRREALSLAEQIIRQFAGCVVLDADALNLMAERGALPKDRAGLLIVTPHLREMSRLCGRSVADIQDHVMETAIWYARKEGVICVLKDAATIVTNGQRTLINRTGNSGMSTGGSGDVLSGMITGLLAQNMDPLDACAAGVYLHGRAGDLCACKMGERGMLSGDLARYIPQAMRTGRTQE